MSVEVVITIITASLALIGSMVTIGTSAKKNDVEALRGIIQSLKEQIDELEHNNEDLKDWAERLVCQVKEAGLEPVKFKRLTRVKDK